MLCVPWSMAPTACDARARRQSSRANHRLPAVSTAKSRSPGARKRSTRNTSGPRLSGGANARSQRRRVRSHLDAHGDGCSGRNPCAGAWARARLGMGRSPRCVTGDASRCLRTRAPDDCLTHPVRSSRTVIAFPRCRNACQTRRACILLGLARSRPRSVRLNRRLIGPQRRDTSMSSSPY